MAKQKRIILIGLVVIGFLFLLYKGGFTLKAIAPGTPIKLYAPDYGLLKCEITGIPTARDSKSMVKCDLASCGGNYAPKFTESKEYQSTYHSIIKCPADSGNEGCKYTISQYVPKLGKKTLQYELTSGTIPCQAHIKKSTGSSWEVLPDVNSYTLEQGQETHIFVSCKTFHPDGYGGYTKSFNREIDPDIAPIWSLTVPQIAIYKYVYSGIGKSEKLTGSEGCSLLGSSAKNIMKKQTNDKSLLSKITKGVYQPTTLEVGIPKLVRGETATFISSWVGRDLIAGGSVNPQGTYKEKDVVCYPGDGLYNIYSVTTIDNPSGYYIQGDKVKNFVAHNYGCCVTSNNECPKGYECGNQYDCVEKAKAEIPGTSESKQLPKECPEGKYFGIQRGITISLREPTLIEGSPCLITKTVDDVGCIHTSKDCSVKCIQSQCDKLNTPTIKYLCSYEKGCEPTTKRFSCPNGQWSDGTGLYEKCDCPANLQSCPDPSLKDVSRGTCRETCQTTDKLEKDYTNGCSNKVDDDGNGLIDKLDPSCQGCIVDNKFVPGIPESECCVARGGTWTTATDKPPFWKFWAGETQREYCDTSKFPITAVIIGLSVLIAGGGLIYYFNKKRR